MLNSIPIEQNTERQLDRLAAQRCLYSRGKRLVILQILLTVPSSVGWAVAVARWPELKGWAAFYGFSVAFVDYFILDRLQKSKKLEAAKIQELFDCDVLQLPWNDVKCGRAPDAEDIVSACRTLKAKDSNCAKLKDWYPPVVGEIPLHFARIICQRSNCRWDSKLRTRYAGWTIAVFSVLAILVFCIGMIGGMTLDKFFLAVVAPLFPTLQWSLREYRGQLDAAESLDRLKSLIHSLWDGALNKKTSENQASQQSRRIQDEIFERRKCSPLIFDAVYWLLRTGHEEEMTKGAEELVSEYLESLK